MAELGVRDGRGEEQRIEVGLRKGGNEEDKEGEDLKPWEQHSAVISIPRYDYKAPSSLMERSHSGFLITCPIKREKSATKEAIPILEEHMNFICTIDFEKPEPCGNIMVGKRRKICSQDADNLDRLEKKTDANLSADFCETAEVASLPPAAAENFKKNSNLSLVKLTRSGLLLFTLPNLNYQIIDTLSSIFRSLDSGNQKSPTWCHRICPIQEICCLTEKNLQAVVTNLVQWYFTSQHDKPERPIKIESYWKEGAKLHGNEQPLSTKCKGRTKEKYKGKSSSTLLRLFAVGYNRRGIEETELKNKTCTAVIALLERSKCFSVVAGAFKKVAENSIVDLKSPEVVILVELLPLSGLPPESLMAGVSLLPSEFAMTKPRLSIKPLVINTERNKYKRETVLKRTKLLQKQRKTK